MTSLNVSRFKCIAAPGLLLYIVAILIGTAVTTGVLYLLKQPVAETEGTAAVAAD